MRIHISNLNSKTTKADLIKLFAEFDEKAFISQIRAIKNTETRLPVIYALVEIDDEANGKRIIFKLDNMVLDGNKIVVAQAF